jgi:biotin operon repressor
MDGNIEKVGQLLLLNQHLALPVIADELDISSNTVRKYVGEDLRKKTGKFAQAKYRTH